MIRIKSPLIATVMCFFLSLLAGLCVGLWLQRSPGKCLDEETPVISYPSTDENLIMPLALFQKYRWNWGHIDEEFSLSPTSKKLLTPEQARLITAVINEFLSGARRYERNLATYQSDSDGSVTVRVIVSSSSQAPVALGDLDSKLGKILNPQDTAYRMLEPGIKKELIDLFPFLIGRDKRVTYSRGNTIHFEEQIEGDSFPSKRNYIPATQKHLLKDP